MQHTTAATLATLRATGAGYLRPLVDMPPLDSMPAGEAGGGDGGGGAATGGGTDGTGGQAPTGGDGAGDQGGTSSTGTGEVTPPLFQEPTPAEVQPPENATGAPPKPAAERSIEDFPPEIQAYIRELRDENASSRVKAKTALEEAQEQFAKERDEWVENLLKATGFMPDIEELGGDGGEGNAPDPAEQVQQLTEQLAQRSDDHRAVTLELAIWKGAHKHGGNPERLTDSRAFMRGVAGIDPATPDFADKVAAAIGTAVETDPYYRTEQQGQVPPSVPDVPSGGDFAGGPSGQRTEPQSVDDYRNLLRKKKRNGGSD